jgi:hypothetical protein
VCDGGIDASTDSGIDRDAFMDGLSKGDASAEASDAGAGDAAWEPDADAGVALPDGGE